MKQKILIVIFFLVLLAGYCFAANPQADAGSGQSTTYDTETTITGNCTDSDDPATDEGTLDRCDWSITSGNAGDCTIISQNRQIIAPNDNTAAITLKCSWWQWWIDEKDYTLRLRTRDKSGESDSSNITLNVSREIEEYHCDNWSTPAISFTSPVPDFSTPIGCNGAACTMQAVLINSGATISDFDFRLRDGSIGWRNAAIKVEVVDDEGNIVEEKTNDIGGTFANNIPLSIDASKYTENKNYFIKTYYAPCTNIDSTSIDTAYDIYYDSAKNWALLSTKEILIIPVTVVFNCWDFPQDHIVDFTQGIGTFAYDSDFGSFVTAKDNTMLITGFAQFNARCTNSVPNKFIPMFKVEVYEANSGNLVATYTNNPAGTLTLNNSISVPFNSHGKYYARLYIKECPPEGVSEIGAHSWDAFLNQYINVLQDWALIQNKPNMANNAYNVIVLNPDEMFAGLVAPSSGNLTVYFPPYDQAYTWAIPWEVTNNSAGTTGQWFKINSSSAVFGEPDPVIIGSAKIVSAQTLTVPGTENDRAILTETFDTLLQETPKTIEMPITLTYDDYWGLTTIPAKTVSATVQVTLVPPPADVLAVKQINISPSKNLPKEIDCFDVAVTLKNFSKATLEPEVKLNFLEAITNQKITTEYAQKITMVYSETGNNELTVVFSCVPLKNNTELEPGKNYWVKAEITNTGTEKTLINDEKREILTIIAATPEAVPETNLILLAIISVALVIMLGKRGH